MILMSSIQVRQSQGVCSLAERALYTKWNRASISVIGQAWTQDVTLEPGYKTTHLLLTGRGAKTEWRLKHLTSLKLCLTLKEEFTPKVTFFLLITYALDT